MEKLPVVFVGNAFAVGGPEPVLDGAAFAANDFGAVPGGYRLGLPIISFIKSKSININV